MNKPHRISKLLDLARRRLMADAQSSQNIRRATQRPTLLKGKPVRKVVQRVIEKLDPPKTEKTEPIIQSRVIEKRPGRFRRWILRWQRIFRWIFRR